MLINMALSESFSRLMERLSDNITKYADKEDCMAEETQERPGSPFLLLLSEGDQEFKVDRSLGSSVEDLGKSDDNDKGTHMLLDSNLTCFSGDGGVCEKGVDVNSHSSEYTCDEASNGDCNVSETSSSHLNNEIKCDLDIGTKETDTKETEKLSSNCDHPMTLEEFKNLFDHCGRLVKEHELRRRIFKGGVIESIRKEVWQFLFELYPFTTTAREREILKVEQTVRYEAMKIRWKKLFKVLVNDYEGVSYCPKWYTGCSKPKRLRKNDIHPSKYVSDCPVDSVCIGNKLETKTEICKIESDSENQECNLLPKLIDFSVKDSNEEQLDDSSTSSLPCTNSSPSQPTLNKDCTSNTNFTSIATESVNTLNSDNISNIKEMITDAMLDTENKITNSHETLYEEVSGKIISYEKSLLGHDDNVSELEHTLPRLITKNMHEDLHYSNEMKIKNDTGKHFSKVEVDDNSYITEKDNFSISKTEKCSGTSCYNIKCSHEGRVHTNLTSNEKLNINVHENSLSGNQCDQVINTTEVDTESLRFQNNDNILLYDETNSKSVDSSSDNIADFSRNQTGIISNSETFSLNNKFTAEITDSPKYDLEEDSLEESGIPYVCKTSAYVDEDDQNIGECVSTSQNTTEKKGVIQTIKKEDENYEAEVSHECRDTENPVSLSAECLQKLPPWIVQVINASTPPRHKSNKDYKHSKESHSKYPCDEFIRAMDDDINKHRELMGIIKNANKYLKEQADMVDSSPITIPSNDIRTICSEKSHSIEGINTGPCTLENIKRNNVLHNLPAKTVTSSSSFMAPISSCGVDAFNCERPQFQLVSNSGTNVIDSTCPYCNFNPEDSPQILLPSSLGEDQLKFMQIQAQVYAARQPYNSNLISESIRVIDKDVPRTDRELAMFQGNDNIGLVKLRDALLTYAFFNPDVGYAQGMNDIMARFLVVMDMESEAYWMFVHYMEHFKHHFMEEGMLHKISLVEQLLMKMDRDLYDYVQSRDLGLMFCHRWLLLNFKREFEYKEAIRLFEITSSRHLEVSSLEAELERSKQRAKEFIKDSAGSHLEEIYVSPEIPFDIFVCVAMLMECRHLLMETLDTSSFYQILSNLPTTLDLQNILEKAEKLFYRYCRRTVVDCFQVIDELEVQDFQ